MFKKLFGQKPVPEEVGDFEPKLDKPRWVKAFQLELSNMEESPVYNLNHELVVGSEIGDIVISDPSISPRHATFSVKEEVVSVFDHGSSTGTYVNKNAIPSGKFVILQEGDLIRIGDLEIKLLLSNHSVDEEDIPALPGEAPALSEKSRINIQIPGFKQPEQVDLPPPEPVVESRPVTITTRQRKVVPRKKVKVNQTIGASSKQGANALLRVASMIGDFLLAYAILILFLPFDEFKTFLSDVPQIALNLLNVDWAQMWGQLKQNHFGIVVMLEDLGTFLSQTFNFLPLLITFGLLRLISTAIFGTTISQFMLGIRSGDNPLWARVGGVLRVVIGFVTWPFVIFDIPAIVSKRTLKEVLTFTQLHVPSKTLSFLGTILYFPLLLILVLVSPIYQGLEMSQPIALDAKIDERVVAEVETPTAAANEVAPELVDVMTTSQHLGLTLTYPPAEFSLFPYFKFVGDKNKLKAQGEAIIVGRENEDWSAQLSVLKNFDLKQLLGMGMHGNFMLFDRYPKIYEFVYSSAEANASFKSQMDEKSREAFAKEFIDFTKTAFELGPDNLIHTMQVRSPFIKGLVDYKSSFLELIEYKDFNHIDFARIGNAIFMRISYLRQEPFDLLIPLIPGTGKIFKITFDKDHGNERSFFSNKLYKYAFFKANWLPERSQASGEVLTPLEVIDVLTIDFKTHKLNSDKAQALYGYYYEKSAEILKRGSVIEMAKWKSSIESVDRMIHSIPLTPVEGEEDPIQKLLQNFQDLKSAFENKNLEFFGISAVQSV